MDQSTPPKGMQKRTHHTSEGQSAEREGDGEQAEALPLGFSSSQGNEGI